MKYVLIAEDDPAIAEILRDGIAERLYVCADVVANGALVMDAVVARRPDLLILDVALPGLNGLDVFELVRNDQRFAGAPVLFLTASPEQTPAASNGGAVHEVIGKPFDLDAVVERVDRLLDGSPIPAAA